MSSYALPLRIHQLRIQLDAEAPDTSCVVELQILDGEGSHHCLALVEQGESAVRGCQQRLERLFREARETRDSVSRALRTTSRSRHLVRWTRRYSPVRIRISRVRRWMRPLYGMMSLLSRVLVGTSRRTLAVVEVADACARRTFSLPVFVRPGFSSNATVSGHPVPAAVLVDAQGREVLALQPTEADLEAGIADFTVSERALELAESLNQIVATVQRAASVVPDVVDPLLPLEEKLRAKFRIRLAVLGLAAYAALMLPLGSLLSVSGLAHFALFSGGLLGCLAVAIWLTSLFSGEW